MTCQVWKRAQPVNPRLPSDKPLACVKLELFVKDIIPKMEKMALAIFFGIW
jgi:hypothetical protein